MDITAPHKIHGGGDGIAAVGETGRRGRKVPPPPSTGSARGQRAGRRTPSAALPTRHHAGCRTPSAATAGKRQAPHDRASAAIRGSVQGQATARPPSSILRAFGSTDARRKEAPLKHLHGARLLLIRRARGGGRRLATGRTAVDLWCACGHGQTMVVGDRPPRSGMEGMGRRWVVEAPPPLHDPAGGGWGRSRAATGCGVSAAGCWL